MKKQQEEGKGKRKGRPKSKTTQPVIAKEEEISQEVEEIEHQEIPVTIRYFFKISLSFNLILLIIVITM